MLRLLSLNAALVAAAAAFCLLAEAEAAPVKCDTLLPDVSGRVTGTADCEVDTALGTGVVGNSALSSLTDFFGEDDLNNPWIFRQKVIDFEGLDAIGLVVTSGNPPDAPLGTGANPDNWEINSLHAADGSADIGPLLSLADQDVMLFFKDGNALPNPSVAYLLSDPSGTYRSPFFNSVDGLIAKEISHISVYTRNRIDGPEEPNQPPAIPLPPALSLLLGGLGMLALMRRRRTPS